MQACRSSRFLAWSGIAGPRPPRRSIGSRSGRSSCTVLVSWTGSSRVVEPLGMCSYSLGYSAPATGRSVVGRMPFDLVGVAGFEPAASSSRTTGSSRGSAVVAAWIVSGGRFQCAAVRGCCCTSVLYVGPLARWICDWAGRSALLLTTLHHVAGGGYEDVRVVLHIANAEVAAVA